MKDGHCEIQVSGYCDDETIYGCEGCRFWIVDKGVKLELIMYISEKACIERFVKEVERLSDQAMKNGILEPKDLMIGDWVWYNPNVFKEDVYEPDKPLEMMQINSGEDIDLAIEGCYSPIELTKGIKAKMVENLGEDAFGKYREEDLPFMIKILNGNGDEYCSGYFRYIHEVQHALRDCGEEEQANNLKIN